MDARKEDSDWAAKVTPPDSTFITVHPTNFMKKLILTFAIMAAILTVAAETTFLKVLFPNTPSSVATCKVYYGYAAGHLTNSATTTNILIAGNPLGFGDCGVRTQVGPVYNAVRIDGLAVGSNFFYACSVIDTNGVECPPYGITTCGFLIPKRPPVPMQLSVH